MSVRQITTFLSHCFATAGIGVQPVQFTSTSHIKMITEDTFGTFVCPSTSKEHTVRRVKLTNKNGLSVQVIDYGAIITAINVPDAKGCFKDIVLGFDDVAGYINCPRPFPYLGATCGRVSNRIMNGEFTLNGKLYKTSKNFGPHTLHGGHKGFDKVLWDSKVESTDLVLSYTSPDGEEGFPGELKVTISFTLTDDNELLIVYKATSDQPTPVNILNHSYFNLAGHDAGKAAMYAHTISVDAEEFSETKGDDLIQTGKILPVKGTPYDLRQPKNMKIAIEATPEKGFDTNYCIRHTSPGVKMCARVEDPCSGRTLECFTDQPAIQLYTANATPDIVGKSGAKYGKHSAFCLETQKYPDSVNHPNFPSTIVTPSAPYLHTVIYKFGVHCP